MSKKDHVKEHIEVENQQDMDAMVATLAEEDPVRDEVAGKKYVGREAVAQRYADLWVAFPDFHVEVTNLHEIDDIVVMEANFSGTMKGVFNGHQPTGKHFKLRLVNIFGFDGDKIASETIFLDYAGQLRQLGISD